MKFPSSIPAFSIDYEIVQVDKVNAEDDDGLVIPDEKKILIKKSLSLDWKWFTLWHEAWHILEAAVETKGADEETKADIFGHFQNSIFKHLIK